MTTEKELAEAHAAFTRLWVLYNQTVCDLSEQITEAHAEVERLKIFKVLSEIEYRHIEGGCGACAIKVEKTQLLADGYRSKLANCADALADILEVVREAGFWGPDKCPHDFEVEKARKALEGK